SRPRAADARREARRDRRRHEALSSVGAGRQSTRLVAQGDSACHRREPAAARDGLHRPLSDPPLRSRYTDRRDAGNTDRPRSHPPRARDRFNRKADEAVIDAVATVASQRGVSPAEVAIAWLLAQPGVTAPIVGATKASHLEDTVKAVSTKLSAEEIATLEGA